MDRDGLLQVMLDDSRPWRFAEQIARSVRSSEGPVLLPQDGALRDLLRRGRWLPRRDGGALAPDAVLIAPKELLHAVAVWPRPVPSATSDFPKPSIQGYGERRSR